MGRTSEISASAIMRGRETLTKNEVRSRLACKGVRVSMFTLNEFAETSRSQMPSWYGSVLTVVGFLVTFVASLSLLGSGAYYVPALTIASAGSAMMVAGVATLLISLVFEDHRDNNEQIEEWQVNEWLEQYKAATNDSRVVVEYSMDCLRNQ